MSCWRFALVVTVIWYENGRKSPTPKRPFHWLESSWKGFAGYMSLLLKSTFISCVDSSFPVNPASLLEHIRGQIIRRWRSIHPLHLARCCCYTLDSIDFATASLSPSSPPWVTSSSGCPGLVRDIMLMFWLGRLWHLIWNVRENAPRNCERK